MSHFPGIAQLRVRCAAGVAVVLLSFGALPNIAWSQCEMELGASDADQGDGMGNSVSLSGDTGVFGAYSDDDYIGSAYVFRFNGSAWGEEQRLVASDRAYADWFGLAVAVDGDVIVVGAPHDADRGANSGSAYVFRLIGSTWVQEQKLTASDGVLVSEFGRSVDVSGDTIVVGAYKDGPTNPFPPGNGAAYVYGFDGSRWIEEQKLIAPDGVPGSYFGYSVAVDGDVALVGAYFDSEIGQQAGAAYVFRKSGSTWALEDKLLDSDGYEWGRFGYSVDVLGDLAVVSSLYDGDIDVSFGSVYLFRFNESVANPEWNEEAELYGSGSEKNGRFGFSVSVGDEIVAVGAQNAGRTGSGWVDGEGAVYIFENGESGWGETEKLIASDETSSDHLGESVSISVSGDLVLAAPGHGHSVAAAGAVYMFTLPCGSSGCVDNGECDDGSFCNGIEVCISGACQGGSAPCGSGLCDEASDACVDCVTNADCSDGAFCNGSEVCVSGVCQSGSAPCGGELCSEATNVCVDCLTNADCNDEAFCNGDELCVGGACQGGSAPCGGGLCDEATNACVECLTNADCNDEAFCNGDELCVGGACQGGSAPCGGGLCDEATNACVECLTGTDCDDDNPCTNDTCNAGSCTNTPVAGCCTSHSQCNDGDPCTEDRCMLNQCQNDNNCECQQNSDCSDGAFCNGDEVCLSGTCQFGFAPCGGGMCDDITNACVDCLTDADCSDGAFCTGVETCESGTCRSGSWPCGSSLCYEVSDSCVECLTSSDCDDGNECTDDICEPTLGCRYMNATNTCTPDASCYGSGVCDAGACICEEAPILKDLAAFLDCMRGPDRAAQPRCSGFDVNRDNIIDMRDFGELDLQ